MVPGGQALGVLADGRKVFVWGGLAGETVEVEVYKVKRSYAEAAVVAVMEASAQRVEARDECYLATSPWQVVDFEYENELKNELVREAFAQAGVVLDEKTAMGTDGREYGYRNKMEYSLWYDLEARKIMLAFHQRGTHRKMPIERSSLERPEIWAEAERVVAELNARGEEARKFQSLVVRCNQAGEVSSALFENGKPRPKMRNLTDRVLGREFSYSPNGFFQINLPVYEMVLGEIREWLGDTQHVVDLYAGVGTIGLTVAGERELVLVEVDARAFSEMERNIPAGARGVTAVCAKSEAVLDYITAGATVIVDPPRAGLDERVVARILEVLPPRVIYLSCNPSTQARDVARMMSGYRIVYQRGFNFFPRTPHIENLVVLERIS
jgi:tRNA/tmRNA/rRNA uracil-C5-methylase (TrmA/RlmC/RlmD family)